MAPDGADSHHFRQREILSYFAVAHDMTAVILHTVNSVLMLPFLLIVFILLPSFFYKF